MKKKNSLFFSFLYPFCVENLADSYFNNTTNKKPTRREKEIKETLRKWKIAKYLTKIWISSFFFFLHSFSIEDQLTHILTMREIKIPKIEKRGSNKERSTTMKSPKPLDLNILVTFLIFHFLVFLLFARREARKEWDLIQVDYPEKFRNDWRHDMEQQLCVSQRVIFATIKPANALLDGKCAR